MIENLKITHILNATNTFESKFESRGVVYLRVGVEDLDTEDISRHFHLAYEFIDHVMRNDKLRVLVHCAQGVSRSATFVIMYLMRAMSISYEQAFNLVKKHREIIKPNEGFTCQLQRLMENHEEINLNMKMAPKEVSIG